MGVITGNGTNNTSPDDLYDFSGPQGETRGVFAKISVDTSGGGGGGKPPSAIPLPPAVWSGAFTGLIALTGAWRVRRRSQAS